MNISEIEKAVSYICETKAKFMDTKELVFNEKFRKMCEENRCGMYGKSYMCPPYVGTFEEVKNNALRYKYMVFYSTNGAINGFSDKEGIQKVEDKHNENAEKITSFFRENIDKDMLIVSSKCPYCKECAVISKEPCRHKDKARACLSAYCIDAAVMAEKSGLKFESDGRSLSFFGAVLFNAD